MISILRTRSLGPLRDFIAVLRALRPRHWLGGFTSNVEKMKVKISTGALSNSIPLVKGSSEQFLFLLIWKAPFWISLLQKGLVNLQKSVVVGNKNLLGVCYNDLVSTAELHFYTSLWGYLTCLYLFHVVRWLMKWQYLEFSLTLFSLSLFSFELKSGLFVLLKIVCKDNNVANMSQTRRQPHLSVLCKVGQI